MVTKHRAEFMVGTRSESVSPNDSFIFTKQIFLEHTGEKMCFPSLFKENKQRRTSLS